MAKKVKLKELPELLLEKPNVYHIQESYLRQIALGSPLTAKKKRKSDVKATSAKWYRQKGTGRARQGERTNPHMYGGGLAFPPRPRRQVKNLNKQVRRSALRSAVLHHIVSDSAFVIQGKDFDGFNKTKDVNGVLAGVEARTINLVVLNDSAVWLGARNLPFVRSVTPEHLNVRDLVESEALVFSQSALDHYKDLLSLQNGAAGNTAPAAAPAADEDGGEE
ncbi:50S ribosomal protein L4 [bacterium]|nr:50S ribosomal protein L4 [bacterium]MCB1220259.1 50S ribosomal protein L4 [bacterium]UNM07939.1 MAG: 50S ribosomal protein L4 [Planctomycetales bacterium]